MGKGEREAKIQVKNCWNVPIKMWNAWKLCSKVYRVFEQVKNRFASAVRLSKVGIGTHERTFKHHSRSRSPWETKQCGPCPRPPAAARLRLRFTFESLAQKLGVTEMLLNHQDLRKTRFFFH